MVSRTSPNTSPQVFIVNLQSNSKKGQLTFHKAEDLYAPDGVFDVDKTIQCK